MLTECFLKQTMYAKKQMLNTVCQNTHAKNQMLKKCKHDLSSNQHRESHEILKKTKEKVNMLQCPISLKQMNFKMECFSSLLVSINTEVIIFNIRLSIITKFNHKSHEQWHLAPMLVYDSVHPRACS